MNYSTLALTMALQRVRDSPNWETVYHVLDRFRKNAVRNPAIEGFPYSKATIPKETQEQESRMLELMYR
ncbi:MAG: hypothetical protein JW716_04380 [Candidatus Aenigmarchaeota archaeon]|nr:hypothetical protein [Candidatus Aenigmarchaeota archaeon]